MQSAPPGTVGSGGPTLAFLRAAACLALWCLSPGAGAGEGPVPDLQGPRGPRESQLLTEQDMGHFLQLTKIPSCRDANILLNTLVASGGIADGLGNQSPVWGRAAKAALQRAVVWAPPAPVTHTRGTRSSGQATLGAVSGFPDIVSRDLSPRMERHVLKDPFL